MRVMSTYLNHAHSKFVRSLDNEYNGLCVLVILFPQTSVLIRSRHIAHIETQGSFLELLNTETNRWNHRFLKLLRFQPITKTKKGKKPLVSEYKMSNDKEERNS